MYNWVNVHQRSLQLLMIEIYKARHDPDLSFMKHIFEEKLLLFNLRSGVVSRGARGAEPPC